MDDDRTWGTGGGDEDKRLIGSLIGSMFELDALVDLEGLAVIKELAREKPSLNDPVIGGKAYSSFA